MFAFYKKKIRKAHNHRRLIPCRFQVTSEAKRIGCSSTQTVTSPSAVRDDCGKDSCLQTSTEDAMYATLSTSIFFTCLERFTAVMATRQPFVALPQRLRDCS